MEKERHSSSDNNVPSPEVYAGGAIKPQARLLHDPAVTFEEYNYYAEKTRAEEDSYPKPSTSWKGLFKGNGGNKNSEAVPDVDAERKVSIDRHMGRGGDRMEITDEEWLNASRAYRTAGMGAVFYLVRRPGFMDMVDAGIRC